MARRWNSNEENYFRHELNNLYVLQNKSLREVATALCVSQQTVFKRLQRLDIPVQRHKKARYNNKTVHVNVPIAFTPELAELFGILLGDGHISRFQVIITLGSQESEYAQYVQTILEIIFKCQARIGKRATGHFSVYVSSVELAAWLTKMGLVNHKVRQQVDVPMWIQRNAKFSARFIRGFIDTDGSIYKLRYGLQISFTNKSLPLLHSLQKMLRALGYTPSVVSAYRVYLTKKNDVERFFREIQPANTKHQRRYAELRVGTQAVKGGAL